MRTLGTAELTRLLREEFGDLTVTPEIKARFEGWRDAGPDRQVYYDVIGYPVGEKPPDTREPTGNIMLCQPCRCARRPDHHEFYFTHIFDDPWAVDPNEWLCVITHRPAVEGERDEAEVFIERLQKKIDRMTPQQRKARIAKLERKLMYRDGRPVGRGLPLSQGMEWIALRENVSVARAIELNMERLADGSYQASGRVGDMKGPVEDIPAEVFQRKQ